MGEQPVVVIPVRDGVPAVGAHEAVAEADELAAAQGHAEARLILVGSRLGVAVEGFSPHGTVMVCEASSFEPGRWARSLADCCSGSATVVLPASADGRDLAVRLAAVLGRPLHSDCVAIGSDRLDVAWYDGRVLATLPVAGPCVATLTPGVRAVSPADRPVTSGDGVDTCAIELVDGSGEPQLLEVLPPDPATVGLGDARRIVGAGAGLMSRTAGDAENRQRFELLGDVGLRIGAALGATRVVTDAGHLPHSRQIGSTGVVVDPELYLAFGISGAVQHTSGLGAPSAVISVNEDPHCPMMAMADLAIVADAPATVAALAERLGVVGAAAVGAAADGAPGDERDREGADR